MLLFQTKEKGKINCHTIRLPGTYAAKIDKIRPPLHVSLNWGKLARGVWFSYIIAAYVPGNLKYRSLYVQTLEVFSVCQVISCDPVAVTQG